ncbi:unnamed protein product [Hymenolepis diminuta]|uniref:Peptidase S1 domain-containing protein n=2 Tax=Hymenolepis diminuta TaxID=6216 RepID=A0A564YA66_HYMDI|nr:unnamed protein product [Hymenolepis diminuta]
MGQLNSCYRLLYLTVLLIFLLELTAGCRSPNSNSSVHTTEIPKFTETSKIIRGKRNADPLFPRPLPPPPMIPPPRELERKYRLMRFHRLKCQCGKDYLVNQTKSFGEGKSFTHSWPWIAGLHKIYLTTKNKRVVAQHELAPFCTASVITNEYLITAMHCLMGLDLPAPAILPKNAWFKPDTYLPYKIFVKFGNHYSPELVNQFKDMHLVDSAYVFTEGLNYQITDIALLKLKTHVVFSDGVRPVCMPSLYTRLPVGTKCFTVGLTNITDADSSGDKLFEVLTPIRKMEDCQRITNFARVENHVCAGQNIEVADNIKSGGGIYCKIHPDDKQYYLIGVSTPGWHKTGLYASFPSVMGQIPTLVGLN